MYENALDSQTEWKPVHETIFIPNNEQRMVNGRTIEYEPEEKTTPVHEIYVWFLMNVIRFIEIWHDPIFPFAIFIFFLPSSVLVAFSIEHFTSIVRSNCSVNVFYGFKTFKHCTIFAHSLHWSLTFDVIRWILRKQGGEWELDCVCVQIHIKRKRRFIYVYLLFANGNIPKYRCPTKCEFLLHSNFGRLLKCKSSFLKLPFHNGRKCHLLCEQSQILAISLRKHRMN